MRASRYIRQNKLDAAQEVLDTIQDKSEIISILPDKLMLQVSIYLQQGNAEKSKEMVDLFDLWEYNKYTTSYQIASQEEDADTILSLLEQMLEALMSPWKLNESVLYHRMAPETKEIQSKEILAIILKELETDPDCEYLREHPKGKELIEKYKAK